MPGSIASWPRVSSVAELRSNGSDRQANYVIVRPKCDMTTDTDARPEPQTQ